MSDVYDDIIESIINIYQRVHADKENSERDYKKVRFVQSTYNFPVQLVASIRDIDRRLYIYPADHRIYRDICDNSI